MLLDQYANRIESALQFIRTRQREKIMEAARMVKEVLANDGLIYVFG